MGGTQQLARLAGGLAGLGLAFAAAAPFSGVPPQGVSGAPVPAQVEVRTLASGEFRVDPVGVALPASSFPVTGRPGGPFVKVKLENQTGVTLRLSVRLSAITPALDDAVLVRASAAGGVLLDGPLQDASDWSQPAGVIASGESTTLRMRFRLKPGLSDDAYRGRLDVRQLQVRGIPLVTPEGTTPATTPGGATTPSGSTTPDDATTSGAAGASAGGNAQAAVYPPVARDPNVITSTPGGSP